MKLLEERIVKDGIFKEGGILKVDSFLNHCMDIDLISELGKEFHRLFADCGINKILTIEASGIGIACIAAQYFNVPVVFAKKVQSKNLDGEVYTSTVHSYTHDKEYVIRVSKKFLTENDRVLIIDDFLAKGKAIFGLLDIIRQSGATLCGAGICIEKGFQEGGRIIREMGINLHSLAIVDMDADGNMIFKEDH
ncbi:MAG: xanthine phosphoribosyltransferase [Clostridia bacterium]|nr:xanthine phosphoribosyltransferase [Clostridia bacterium]MBQ4575342.1 xanthine phosphoribosyltransferase [Clostridia bacterium]